jgi:GNAT superfamily N-acetyltransferase
MEHTRVYMDIRRLDAEEFEQLQEIADGWCPDPQVSRAGVAIDGERTVARVFIVAPVHIEGPWIAEEYRHGTLAARLVKWAERQAREVGVQKLFAYGANAEIEGYLERLGFKKQPLTVWAKEL